jgi:hypothetical protein
VLLGAAWPLLHDGSADQLRELASRELPPDDPLAAAPRMARELLSDLGLLEADGSGAVVPLREASA